MENLEKNEDFRGVPLVFPCVSPAFDAAPRRVDRRLRHLRQGLQGVAGLVLRPGGDARVQQYDDEDRYACGVGQRVVLLLTRRVPQGLMTI